jgi:phage terminase small subunit
MGPLKLRQKERIFVNEYLIDRNGTRSAIAAAGIVRRKLTR